MVINIRSDGTEFDPADIRITKEAFPELYTAVQNIIVRIQEGDHSNED